MPIDGSAPPIVLNEDLVFGGDVRDFVISPAGGRLVYVANQDTYPIAELYSVPLDGSESPVKLNGPFPSSESVLGVQRSPRITDEGGLVLFLADADTADRLELWKVPIGGGVAPRRLNGSLVHGGDVQDERSTSVVREGYDVTPDGMRVLYRADQQVDDAFALWEGRTRAHAACGRGTSAVASCRS